MKLLAVLLLFPALASAAMTPQDIREQVHKYGTVEFSAKVSPNEWKAVLDNISSGKGEWIALAPDLAPAINLQQANQLTDALYYALAPNAKETLKVLAILDKHHDKYQQGTALSCVSPLDKPKDEMLRIYNHTRLSLLDAGPQAAECLWSLEGWIEEVKAEEAQKAK
ncbi:hypothetical protein [Rouxiella sp. Mn2063]|uniref:hypothetical protein n=1 Tax=Rouxiella sp. Mn2063 TaxID=3395262 RepID=UPI003BC37B06